MKKSIMMVMVLLCIGLVLTGCGEKAVKETIGGLIEAQNKDNEKQSDKKEDLETTKDPEDMPKGEHDAIKWPEWVPDEIPEYKYGDLWKSDRYDEYTAMLLLTNINEKKDPFNAYIKDLEKKGWVEETGWTEPEGDNEFIIHMIHEEKGYYLSYYYCVEEDEVFGNIIYDVEPVDLEEEEGDGKYTFDIEGEDGVSGEIGNEELPDDFPVDFCPIYPGADIVLAQQIKDEEMSIFNVMLVSKDEMDEVAEFYADNENIDMKMGDYLITLVKDEGEMTASVQIVEAEEEHAKQGYKTFIVISLAIEY